ncbi:MAG: hypothetical protein K940chlam7_00094 [Chlamydiae bacterium]|nr:hypothetical protein [Chlamydiota bacterium]
MCVSGGSNHISSNRSFDISVSASSLSATETTSDEKTASIDEILNGIATKLLSGQDITKAEAKTLENITATPQGKGKLTSTQKKLIKTTDKLAKEILKSKGSYKAKQQKVRKLLDSVQDGDLVTQQVKVKVLLAMHTAREASYCQNKATEILKKKGTISEKEILKLIEEDNKACPPLANKAGTLAFQAGKHKVFYDSKGKLTLASPDRKATVPIEQARNNKKLKPAQVAQMIQTLHDVVDNTPYNNVGPMLEFMKFFREASTNNPELTLSQAFEAHQSSPEQVYDKYHSGDCVIFAGKLKSELSARGFKAAIAGQYTGTAWARPPLPETSGNFSIWKGYDQATENVQHCCTVVRYSDRKGEDRVLALDTWAGDNEPADYDSFSAWTDMSGALDTTEGITNIGHILKMQMRGKSKMILMGKAGMQEQFGIDLIRGNIYLNTGGAKGLDGLPLGASGRFSISLQDLRDNPDRQATYYVDGNPVQMTHREALEAFQGAAGERFQLPRDFSGNIMTLAENADDLVSHVLISTVATAKQVSNVAMGAHRLVLQTDDKAREYKNLEGKEDTPEPIRTLINAYLENQEKMRQRFDSLQQKILDDDVNKVRNHAATITAMAAELAQIVAQIEAEPPELANL